MSHVTDNYNKSCHIWLQWCMSHVNVSCQCSSVASSRRSWNGGTTAYTARAACHSRCKHWWRFSKVGLLLNSPHKLTLHLMFWATLLAFLHPVCACKNSRKSALCWIGVRWTVFLRILPAPHGTASVSYMLYKLVEILKSLLVTKLMVGNHYWTVFSEF